MKNEFSITILGSSAALPSFENFSSAQVIKADNELFLVDAGEGVQIQLRRFKIKYFAIENIFISHLHGDHFFGLLGLLSSYNLLHRTSPLHIYAPEQLPSLLNPILNGAFNGGLNYPIFFHSLKQGTNKIYESAKISIYSFELKHSIPVWGFLFEEKKSKYKIKKDVLSNYNLTIEQIRALTHGEDIYVNGKIIKNSVFTLPPPPPRKYAYITDTIFYPEIIPIIKNVSLLYHEATFLSQDAEIASKTMHSTAEQAAKIAKMANVKTLLLGHFSDRYSQKQLFFNEAKKIFNNVLIASDGMKLFID